MLRLRQSELPYRGSSYNFVGADHGDVGVSVFLFRGKPGSGPGPHRHPYDEIQFIQSGRGRWTVEGKTFEAGGGDVLVIKAGEVHSPPSGYSACANARLVIARATNEIGGLRTPVVRSSCGVRAFHRAARSNSMTNPTWHQRWDPHMKA